MQNNKNSSFFRRLGAFLTSPGTALSEQRPRLHQEPAMALIKCDVRLDMERRLSEAKKPLPTEDQWRMILSPEPCTRVVAGAGSGKSTTLVLRVIALAAYRGVSLDSLRVVTFTRNSRADFIEKLCVMAPLWGIELTAKQASVVVRTFHSLVFAQAKAAGLSVSTLDQLDAAGASDSSAAPFASLSVDPDSVLAATLNDVAATLMKQNPSFARVVTDLYRHSFLVAGGMHLDPNKAGRISVVQTNDHERTAFMQQYWETKVAPELMKTDLIDFRVQAFETGPLQINGVQVPANGPWYANAYIPSLNAWLLLGAAKGTSRSIKMPDGFPLMAGLGAKKSCVNVLSSNANLIWVNTAQQLNALLMKLQWGEKNDGVFPKFGVKLTGELVSTPLLVAFWQQAQFIESLGIDVEQAALKASTSLQGVDKLFAHALALFWPAFVSHVKELGYTLSNNVFQALSDPELLKRLPDEAIMGVQHLLIDEFQDISGIIVNWLCAVRAEIARRGHQASLMVVGDDWQSIYGWRGASPRYFTQFFSYFGANGGNEHTVYLSENFRSSQRIVSAASIALRHVKDKIDKTCVASGQFARLDEPVQMGIIECDDPINVPEYRAILAKDSVFVIGRTRNALKAFSDEQAKCLTVHASKGLEADYVLFVEDFCAPGTHPLRCVWYDMAKLGNYDSAQSDETMRLAYVAITRAKKGCAWFVPSEVGGGVFGRFAAHNDPNIALLEVCDA